MVGVGHWWIGHFYRFGLQAQCQPWPGVDITQVLSFELFHFDSGASAAPPARQPVARAAANAKLVILFHFSPCYAGREEELRRVIETAWAGFT